MTLLEDSRTGLRQHLYERVINTSLSHTYLAIINFQPPRESFGGDLPAVPGQQRDPKHRQSTSKVAAATDHILEQEQHKYLPAFISKGLLPKIPLNLQILISSRTLGKSPENN